VAVCALGQRQAHAALNLRANVSIHRALGSRGVLRGVRLEALRIHVLDGAGEQVKAGRFRYGGEAALQDLPGAHGISLREEDGCGHAVPPPGEHTVSALHLRRRRAIAEQSLAETDVNHRAVRGGRCHAKGNLQVVDGSGRHPLAVTRARFRGRHRLEVFAGPRAHELAAHVERLRRLVAPHRVAVDGQQDLCILGRPHVDALGA